MKYINFLILFFFWFFDSNNFFFSFFTIIDNRFFNKTDLNNNNLLFFLLFLITLRFFLWYIYIYKNKKWISQFLYFYFWLNFILTLIFFVFLFLFLKYFYLFFQNNSFDSLHDLISLENNFFSFKKLFFSFLDFFSISNDIQLVTGPFNFCIFKCYSLNDKITYSRLLWDNLNLTNNLLLHFPEMLIREYIKDVYIIYDIKKIIVFLHHKYDI